MASWCSNTVCRPSKSDVFAKILLDPLGLRQPVGDAAGTEHLKRLDYHDLASEIGQGRIVGSVEPAGDGQFRGSVVYRLHGHVSLSLFEPHNSEEMPSRRGNSGLNYGWR